MAAGYEAVFSKEDILFRFQSTLCDWFDKSGKDYPWRQTSDPYAILVSELMLQQTQIATVLGRGYYGRWMAQFGNWEALAQAKEEDILKAWEGLGYYNRARNLQKTAIRICDDYGGVCPRDTESLEKLPGVGRYTAGAVASFAFGVQAPIVDGNVARVLSRLFDYRKPVDTAFGQNFLWATAARMTPGERVRSYNSAIMELGQQVCTKGVPDCGECPVAIWCLSKGSEGLGALPLKKAKVAITKKSESVIILTHEGRVFLERESGRRRNGLWKLPEIPSSETEDLEELMSFDYAITRFKVTLKVFELPSAIRGKFAADREGKWYNFNDEASLPPLGSPYRKAIQKYQNTRNDLG